MLLITCKGKTLFLCKQRIISNFYTILIREVLALITQKVFQYTFSILGVLSLGFFYYQMFKGESRKSDNQPK
jgi:hypothetical protein